MRKYVHRVGRTARAGREGDAWTLVEDQEARHFKIMMREADHLSKLAKLKITDADLEPLLPHYEVRIVAWQVICQSYSLNIRTHCESSRNCTAVHDMRELIHYQTLYYIAVHQEPSSSSPASPTQFVSDAVSLNAIRAHHVCICIVRRLGCSP